MKALTNETNPSLESILDKFKSIELQEMNCIKLLNRHDVKFVLSIDLLVPLLGTLLDDYEILEIEGKRIFKYETLYFDTDDYLFYHQHHNGKKNRYKIRVRKYSDSGLCYLEIKHKNNKGKTKKSRLEQKNIQKKFNEDAKEFITNKVLNKLNINDAEILPKIWTNFRRITLANRETQERLTIDLGLSLKKEKKPSDNNLTNIFDKKIENKLNDAYNEIKQVVIIELKKDKSFQKSVFTSKAKELGILPSRFSKYCAGIMLVSENVKKNKFKERILKIKQIDQRSNI